MHRKFISFVLLLALCAVIARAEDKKHYLNLDRNGVIIKGYDPVAYFTDGKPVKGDAKFESSYEGAKYRFASEEHKKLFDADPEKYAVQYGGFCGYAVSKGYTASIDPNAFLIEDGRLVLQNGSGALDGWKKNAESLKNADANWPKIVEKKGK